MSVCTHVPTNTNKYSHTCTLTYTHTHSVNSQGYDNAMFLTGTEGRVDVGTFVGEPDGAPVNASLFRDGKLHEVSARVCAHA
jgi:hypothetical protein